MRFLIPIIAAAAFSAAAVAQETGVLRIRVVVTDADGNAVPVPRAQLLISDNPSTREPRRVRTDADGRVDVTLPAGNYTVESDIPVRLGARNFAWIQTLDVPAGRDTVLELTADNADADVDAAAAVDMERATPADGAVILSKWQASIAEIWTPTRHANGFVIDARGLIATNDRALGEATEVEVEFGNAAERVKVAGRVIATDRPSGVTIVWIDPEVTKSRPPIVPACTAPSPPAVAHDDRVVTLIAPMLEPKTAIPGSVIRPTAQSFRADWRLDAVSAGGPVFSADGVAIGITVGHDEQDTRRGTPDSYVIPLANACSMLAAAGRKIEGAKPPPGTLLRTEAGLPRAKPARPGDPQQPQMLPLLVRAEDYDIALMTPSMVRLDRIASNTRNFFGNWTPYITAAPEVLLVRISPQFEESIWRSIARGAASTQGVNLPPMPSFSANFGRMRAFCGAAEVMPIRRLQIEIPVQKRDPIRDAAYVFALTDFGPHCGTVRFELFSEKAANRGDVRTIDPALFTKIADSSR
ncbi:MAG TPA: trypsin-like peptidase domain-containing protein [Vicinamibacterales bacterium]